ncbi:hypothetical protein JR316_0007571 [Psilocybe cubensis]|nr:hypothetical protein JR316_0007571 [Psilocybe cubensis]KAH9480964.1 hypothetical protein JR316_0007571 [Psilocybe cubensis]
MDLNYENNANKDEAKETVAAHDLPALSDEQSEEGFREMERYVNYNDDSDYLNINNTTSHAPSSWRNPSTSAGSIATSSMPQPISSRYSVLPGCLGHSTMATARFFSSHNKPSLPFFYVACSYHFKGKARSSKAPAHPRKAPKSRSTRSRIGETPAQKSARRKRTSGVLTPYEVDALPSAEYTDRAVRSILKIPYNIPLEDAWP